MSAAVLVTGGAGYIGSHTCKALVAAGFLPVTYDNLSKGHRWAVRWGPLVEGDIHDRNRLAFTLHQYGIEAIVHFAAFAYVGESMREPGGYFANNVAGSLTLLEAAHAAGDPPVVFSSSCATYGVPGHTPIAEAHPQLPCNPYGESKLFVERALHWYGEAHAAPWVSLRYFNAAGADADGETGEDHDPETHLIPLAIEAALGLGPALQVFGTDYPTRDGTAVRDYIHVTDLAAAHVEALQHLRGGGHSLALNLGTGQGHSVRQVVDTVSRVGGQPVPVVEAPRRAGDPPELVADASRARATLDWRPVHSDLDNIVETAWRWHSRQVDKLPECQAAVAS